MEFFGLSSEKSVKNTKSTAGARGIEGLEITPAVTRRRARADRGRPRFWTFQKSARAGPSTGEITPRARAEGAGARGLNLLENRPRGPAVEARAARALAVLVLLYFFRI